MSSAVRDLHDDLKEEEPTESGNQNPLPPKRKGEETQTSEILQGVGKQAVLSLRNVHQGRVAS